MIWVVVAIVAFIVIKIIYGHNERAEHVLREGGMRNKYKTLVDAILEGNSKAQIVEQDSVSLRIVYSSIGGCLSFQIVQGDGYVEIYYDLKNSPIVGSDSLKWRFPEYQDQEKMLERIYNDMNAHNSAIMSNVYGF